MRKERNTGQKEMIVEYLKKNQNKHITVQEIKMALNDDVGLTTIYRVINSLIEKGVMSKIPFDNKQGYCYQYNSDMQKCNNHPHLICEKCNKLIHFDSKQALKMQKEAENVQGFSINNDRLVFYGVCKECKK